MIAVDVWGASGPGYGLRTPPHFWLWNSTILGIKADFSLSFALLSAVIGLLSIFLKFHDISSAFAMAVSGCSALTKEFLASMTSGHLRNNHHQSAMP